MPILPKDKVVNPPNGPSALLVLRSNWFCFHEYLVSQKQWSVVIAWFFDQEALPIDSVFREDSDECPPGRQSLLLGQRVASRPFLPVKA